MILEPFIRDQASADALVEGFYQISRWRAERVPIPVRVWFGAPLDPDEDPSRAQVLDRAPRWQVMVGGVLLDHEPVNIGGLQIASLSDIWPTCMRDPITRAEHDYLVARAEWAAAYDPNDPFGTTSGRIDPMSATLPFMEGV